ncbi:MAG TPA: hypothetical protein VNM37_21565 [Candidatus Dormibacteraeota bacterium]|nr:hypothetical protein [Candidatus Dormibacteraeota bacterium]
MAARKFYLTASDVPAVLGLDTRSRRSVLRDKLDPAPRKELHVPMVAAGRHLERGVFEWWLADQALPAHVELDIGLVQSPAYSWLAATPDAVVDDEPVEIKVSMWSSRPNWHAATRTTKGWPKQFPLPTAIYREVTSCPVPGPPKDDTPAALWRGLTRIQLQEVLPKFGPPEVPLKYWVQLQVQMHVLEADHGTIVALQGGTDRYDLVYEIAPDFQTWMFGELERFRKEWHSLIP